MWQEKNKALIKEFKFKDFKGALEFVNKVGDLAEAANHHPDVKLGWGTVIIKLTSHDVGKVTARDHKLAEAIDEISKS